MEGFSSDTVLDWIRKGILKLRVVPDMIYGGSVDVGTVPVEKSVVWRTMFAEGTDGCSFIPAIRLIDYNSLNLRHPNAKYFTQYDDKLEGMGLVGIFPDFQSYPAKFYLTIHEPH
jgi:hypothetical protein